MRKIIYKNTRNLIFFSIIVAAIVSPCAVLAVEKVDTLGYVPLANIPNASPNNVNSLGDYLGGLYKTGVAVAGVLAVLMIVYGGFGYISTDSITGKSDSKGIIQGAISGLLLAFASYAILYTINPQLVSLNIIKTPLEKNADTGIMGFIFGLEEKQLAIDIQDQALADFKTSTKNAFDNINEAEKLRKKNQDLLFRAYLGDPTLSETEKQTAEDVKKQIDAYTKAANEDPQAYLGVGRQAIGMELANAIRGSQTPEFTASEIKTKVDIQIEKLAMLNDDRSLDGKIIELKNQANNAFDVICRKVRVFRASSPFGPVPETSTDKENLAKAKADCLKNKY